MIVDGYEPVNLVTLVPQLGSGFAPALAALNQLLDDDAIVQRVRGWSRPPLMAPRCERRR